MSATASCGPKSIAHIEITTAMVTPEMIEAGFNAFAEGGFACEHLNSDLARQMIVEVYRAINLARDKGRQEVE